jgi:MFS transporter, DHA1 family, inner membrane transport protein
MAFFRNDAVNRIYLHSAVQALAQNAGNLFLLVFLMRAGTPAPVALLAQAAIVAGRFALRPMLLPLARRFGLKPLIIAGALGVALQYPILAEVRGPGWALVALVAIAAVAEVLYYGSLNAYFSAVGDPEHRGHNASLREMLVALAAIAAPPACAFGLIAFGPRPTFAVVALIQLLSVLPLLGARNVTVRDRAPGAFQAARFGAVLIAVDGWLDAGFFFVWQVALFLALGEDIAAFGGAMAAAGLAGAVFGLWLGPRVDAGHGRRAALIAYGAGAAVVALRTLSLGSPWLAVAANAAGALFMPLLVPPLVAATANMARASPCPLRYAMATEGGWDAGCFAACVLAAAMLALGAPLELCVLLALPACLAGLVLLRRYYARPTLV